MRRKLSLPLLNMAAPYIESISIEENIKAALMYDPLTVYYLLEPQNCRARLLDVRIETKGELTRGMSVAELRKGKSTEFNVNVVEFIEETSFKKKFIQTLSD